ncbi:MAG: hypothetical protein WDN04_18690 [Rhodospirillales bacterium]
MVRTEAGPVLDALRGLGGRLQPEATRMADQDRLLYEAFSE